jgi:hypothetical protein
MDKMTSITGLLWRDYLKSDILTFANIQITLLARNFVADKGCNLHATISFHSVNIRCQPLQAS